MKITKKLIEKFVSCTPKDENECEACPYIGACMEYYTGDDSENEDGEE